MSGDELRGESSLPPAAQPARKVRVRRTRSVTESLLSIVLLLESFLVFFVTLVVYGLRALDPVVTFVGGAVFIVLLLATSGVLRHPAGIAFGWLLQVALIATGFITIPMFFVAAVFAGIWVFCFIKGRQIDRQKAEYAAALSQPTDS